MAASTVESSSSEKAKPANYFATTHWSVILSAGRQDTRATIALERLCATYWYPLYAYVRRRGYSPHDAQDLTQSFFECLLERQSLANADPNKGRFRSFILGAMNHFLAKQWAKVRAQKRGGGRPLLSFDTASGEERFALERTDEASPDTVFDKQWATALLDKVLGLLEADYQEAGKAELFKALRQTLALNMNEGAVKTAVHRLRKRYRQLLEAEIANTVASPDEIREEMAYLLRVVGS
jgi:DNA-directed RNA polymerase specialized sigma24 family protein